MNIGIIGCGNMGSAIAQKLSAHHNVYLYDHNRHKLECLANQAEVYICPNLEKLLESSEFVILAIKPANLEGVACSLKPFLTKKHVLVSILGGVTLDRLSLVFGHSAMIKMMPNIPILCSQGLMSVCFHPAVQTEQRSAALDVFALLGKTIVIPESKMEAMTSLAGCGPAFVFMIVESMIDAGIYMGLSKEEARHAAIQMIQGSSSLMAQSEKSPSDLKWLVTSPGGSTIAGVKSLEDSSLRSAIMKAFIAAFEKSKLN